MDQTNCPDCRLLYKTEEGVVTIDAHMFILIKSAYLDALFRWQESVPVKVGKKYINQYTVDMPFDHNLMELCIKMMYDQKEVRKIINIDGSLFAEVFAIVDFLQLDNLCYDDIINIFLSMINKKIDYSKMFNIITAVCNSNIEINRKQNFIARTLYLLNEEDKQTIEKQYIPEHIYHGKSYIDNDNLIICGDYKFEYNGWAFSTDFDWCDETMCYFKLSGCYLDDFRINLRVFDGNTIHSRDGYMYVDISPCGDACDLYISGITGYPVFEFILTPKKTENSN